MQKTYMTDEQRYSAVLKALGELLEENKNMIAMQRWQIEDLQEKLKRAEEKLARIRDEGERLMGTTEGGK